MSENRLFSKTELAKKWHLSEGTLRNWRSQEKGPDYVKLNGKVGYKPEDIDALKKTRTKNLKQKTGPALP